MKLWLITDYDDGGLAVCTTKESAEKLLADTENIPYSKSGEEYYIIEEIDTDNWITGHAG